MAAEIKSSGGIKFKSSCDGSSSSSKVRIDSYVNKKKVVEKSISKSELKMKTTSSSSKIVKKRVTRAKVFSLPGQKYEVPEEREPLRIFYESLSKQIPSSEMAEFWGKQENSGRKMEHVHGKDCEFQPQMSLIEKIPTKFNESGSYICLGSAGGPRIVLHPCHGEKELTNIKWVGEIGYLLVLSPFLNLCIWSDGSDFWCIFSLYKEKHSLVLISAL